MMDAALAYAARGWPVFPVKAKSKSPPLTKRGHLDASIDEATIRSWWTTNPKANIGIATGGAFGIVVDVDDREALSELPGQLPETRFACTGSGGWHLMFATAPISNKRGSLPDGIDVRGDGTGYVVAPPSIHPCGEPYRWGNGGPDAEQASLPAWFLDILGTPPGVIGEPPQGFIFDPTTFEPEPETDRMTRAQSWLACRAPAISGHRGHDWTYTTAMHVVRGFDLTEPQAFDAMIAWNMTCQPPWTDKELRRKISEADSTGQMIRGEKLDDAAPTYSTFNTLPSLAASVPRYQASLDEPQLPPFPLRVFPDWLASWVTAVAVSTQTPPDLAAMLALACCATALAKRYEVHVRPDWIEPLNLWIVVAMPPSSGKTPVLKHAKRPLQTWEKDRNERRAGDIAASRDARRVEEGVLERLLTQAEKSHDPLDRSDLLDQARAQRRRVDRLPRLEATRLVADDVTPEALVGLLERYDGRLAIISDEGGILGIAAGRYSGQVANAEAILQAHSGGTIIVDRRDRHEYVDSAALSLGLTVQPQVLREVGANPALRGRGLLCRPLFVLPKPLTGCLTPYSAPPVPEEVTAAYTDGLMMLLDEVRYRDGVVHPEVLSFTEGAYSITREWTQRVRTAAEEGGQLHPIADWVGKVYGTVARLAGILALAHDPDARGVDYQAAWGAQQVMAYAIEHARAAFSAMDQGEEVAQARIVLKACQRHPKAITRRDVLMYVKNYAAFRGQGCAKKVDETLAYLVDHGHLLRSGGGFQLVASCGKLWQAPCHSFKSATTAADTDTVASVARGDIRNEK
jgi:hypothetical protein